MFSHRLGMTDFGGLTGVALSALGSAVFLSPGRFLNSVAVSMAGLIDRSAVADTGDTPSLAPAAQEPEPPVEEPSSHLGEDDWRRALDALGEGVWEWFPATGTMRFSDGWRAMLGCCDVETVDTVQKWAERIHPEDWLRTLDDMESHLAGNTEVYENEHRARCEDGSYKWVLDRGVVVSRDAEGAAIHVIGVRTDITQRKAMEDQLWRQAVELSDANERLAEMAITDTLTGLRNRRGFLQYAENELAAVAAGGRLGIAYIDIDFFKRINDTFGHEIGDVVLREIANRLASHVAVANQVGRMGGEEFALCLPGADCRTTAEVAEAARRHIAEEPVTMPDGRTLNVSASFGVTCTDGGDGLSALLSRADQALYEAKDAGRNRVRAVCRVHATESLVIG